MHKEYIRHDFHGVGGMLMLVASITSDTTDSNNQQLKGRTKK